MRRSLNVAHLGMVSAVLVFFAVAAVIFFGYPATSQITGISPAVTQSLTLPTTAGGTAVLIQNPTRKAMRICNSGATNVAWICPAGVTPAANAAGCLPLAAVASSVAACFTDPIFGGAPDTAAWNGIAVTGSTTLTVMEYY